MPIFFNSLRSTPSWRLPLACAITIAGVAALCVLVHALIIAPILGFVPINQLLAIGTGYRSSCRASPPTLLFGTKFRNLGLRLPKLVLRLHRSAIVGRIVLRRGNYHLAILQFSNRSQPHSKRYLLSTTPTQPYRSSDVDDYCVHAGRPAVITNRKRNRHRVLNRQTDVLRNHPEM